MFTVSQNSLFGAPQSRWRALGFSYFFASFTLLLCAALALAMSSPTRMEELRRKAEEKREESSQEATPVLGQEAIKGLQAGDDPLPFTLTSSPQQFLDGLTPATTIVVVKIVSVPTFDLPFDPRPTWQSNSSPPALLS